MTIKKILCPIDLSDTSILGLQQATEIAVEHDAELVVMHVSNDFFRADQTSDYYTMSMNTFIDEVRRLKRVVRDLHDIRSRAHHCLGNPPHEIIEFARNEACDLIVLGSHGRSGFRKMILGSVAETVVKNAETSVLVVKESSAASPVRESVINGADSFRCFGRQPVIVPFDFSEACIAALEFTTKLGIAPQRLRVVTVVDPPDPLTAQGPKKQKRESEIIAANRRFFFEEWCPTGFRDVELVTLFSSDVPGQLGNYANEIDASLIIMPTNQKNFVTRFLLGSVASMVVRTSPCPTLVVKNTPVVILDQSSSDNAHQKNP